jgi:hypothetical protein
MVGSVVAGAMVSLTGATLSRDVLAARRALLQRGNLARINPIRPKPVDEDTPDEFADRGHFPIGGDLDRSSQCWRRAQLQHFPGIVL